MATYEYGAIPVLLIISLYAALLPSAFISDLINKLFRVKDSQLQESVFWGAVIVITLGITTLLYKFVISFMEWAFDTFGAIVGAFIVIFICSFALVFGVEIYKKLKRGCPVNEFDHSYAPY